MTIDVIILLSGECSYSKKSVKFKIQYYFTGKILIRENLRSPPMTITWPDVSRQLQAAVYHIKCFPYVPQTHFVLQAADKVESVTRAHTDAHSIQQVKTLCLLFKFRAAN